VRARRARRPTYAERLAAWREHALTEARAHAARLTASARYWLQDARRGGSLASALNGLQDRAMARGWRLRARELGNGAPLSSFEVEVAKMAGK